MKFILFLLPILAIGQAIQLTPANPVATQGSSVTITADRPVYFTLNGAGSINTTQGNSTTYTAPSAIARPHVMNGCMVLPANSIFNTTIDNLPVHPNSAAWVPNMASTGGLQLNGEWGVNVIDNSTPLAPQYFHYTNYLDGTNFPVIPNSQRHRESGSYTDDPGNDHHMLSVNHESCQFYETYQDGISVPGCAQCTTASGLTYASTSFAQPSYSGSTDAAGLPLFPLTLHLDELEAGEIKHPLRFTSCVGCISQTVAWPAVTSTGWAPAGAPMGSRFRLKSSFDVSGYPPAAQAVLNAMKHYGMFLADIGLMGDITMSTDITRDQNILKDVQTINGLAADNFDIVDESSLMLDPTLNVANPNNPYVKPANSAILTVTDAANPANSIQVPIALQPVTVGTSDAEMTVQAGTNPFPVQSWVNGTANQNVTWSISPALGAGSIAADGTYTAPALIGDVTHATLTATSEADPTASASVTLTVIPAGLLRIDSGSPKPTVDENGNAWLQDLGFENGSNYLVNDWYPLNAWSGVQFRTQFQTYRFTWGDDIVYHLHVPNGNYNVAILLGIGGEDGSYTTTTWDNGLIWGPLNIEAQGQVTNHSWNFGYASNFQYRTPVTLYIPAKVTDTNLVVALRALNNTVGHSAPFINGITVTPDYESAHLSVDSQIHVVTAGSLLQLYATDWFSGSQNIKWQKVVGPGTISATGVYAAPLHVSTGQWVVVRARDTVTNLSTTFNLFVPAPGSALPNVY